MKTVSPMPQDKDQNYVVICKEELSKRFSLREAERVAEEATTTHGKIFEVVKVVKTFRPKIVGVVKDEAEEIPSETH